jgi:hypothetical protein
VYGDAGSRPLWQVEPQLRLLLLEAVRERR